MKMKILGSHRERGPEKEKKQKISTGKMLCLHRRERAEEERREYKHLIR